MKPIDYAKALALAAAILILDFGCAYLTVTLWAMFVDPGHSPAYYIAAAPRLSTLSTRAAGPVLFLASIWLFSTRRPERNPYLFAVAVFLAYVLLDGGTVQFQGFFTRVVLVTMVMKLAGALVGAGLSRRLRASA